MKENPDYRDAPYELGVLPLMDLGMPHRFNTLPPEDVWRQSSVLIEWVIKNSIPPFIEEKS
jgi:hypothetical protein